MRKRCARQAKKLRSIVANAGKEPQEIESNIESRDSVGHALACREQESGLVGTIPTFVVMAGPLSMTGGGHDGFEQA
jgi:hypothetical protein